MTEQERQEAFEAIDKWLDEAIMEEHYVGEIVAHKGHVCKVLAVWSDEGRSGITIAPTGGYGFPIDIYDEQL